MYFWLGSLLGASVFVLSACGARSELAPAGATTDAGTTSPSDARADADIGDEKSTLCTWSESFGDQHGQFVTGLGVAPGGDVLVTGLFRGVLELGGQTLDSKDVNDSNGVGGAVFLARLDAHGTPLWSRAFLPLTDNTVTLAVDHEGNAVLHTFSMQTLDFGDDGGAPGAQLAKFDPQGKLLWRHPLALGAAQTIWTDIAIDASDNIILWAVAEDSTGPVLQLGKLDPQGELVWAKSFPFPYDKLYLQAPSGHSVAADAQGGILVATGAVSWGPLVAASLDFGGGPLTIPAGGRNVFLAKFDPQGNPIYSRLLTETTGVGNLGIMAPSIATGSAGEAFITCSFSGTAVDAGNGLLVPPGTSEGFLVARLDPSGKTTWSRLLGDDAFSHALAVTTTGDVALSGGINASLDLGGGPLQNESGTTETFIATLSGATGNHLASRIFGPGPVAIDLLAAEGQGRIVAAGRLYDSVEFCGKTVFSAGRTDLLLAELAP